MQAGETQSIDGRLALPSASPAGSAQETWIIGGIVVAALYFGQHVFVPLALAVLLTFVLAPFVRGLHRMRFGRVTSVILVVTLAFSLIIGAGALITSQITELAQSLPVYQATLKEKVKALKGVAGGGAIERASQTLKDLQKELEKSDTGPPNPVLLDQSANPIERPALEKIDGGRPIPVEVHQPEPTPLDQLQRIIGVILSPLATTGVVILLVIFMLLQREDLRDRAIRLLGTHDLERSTTALDDAGYRLSRYFLTLTALNTAFGIFVGCGLWLIGVPSAILWGILAAVMRFVPFIGSFIAAALPVLLAAAVDPGWTMLALTLALYIVGETFISNAIEPFVQGQSTGLSPLAIVFSAAFWTLLWGPIGLLLAIPLTVVLVVLGSHIERLEFLSVLFGDVPPLSPAERFYQRMLAGDPAEAIEQADSILKTKPLITYCDEVIIAALNLAQTDLDRGVLLPERLREVEESTSEVIEALDEYPLWPVSAKESDSTQDKDASTNEPGSLAAPRDAREISSIPEEWKSEGAIICVGARTPLDEAAAEALAQVLRKQGFGARTVARPTAISRYLREEDLSGARAICLSALDVRSRSAHARFLARRLRRAIPDAVIIGCFWSTDHADELHRSDQQTAPFDEVATSLAEAVDICARRAIDQSVNGRDVGQSVTTVSAA